MCGVPYHAARQLPRRAWSGRAIRVAICEQVEDPRKAKGVVKREVVRVCLARHAARRRLPRRARAVVPAGDRAGRASGIGRRAARPVDRRVHDGGVRRARIGWQALERRARGAAAARDRRASGCAARRAPARDRAARRCRSRGDRALALRAREPRGGRCSTSCARGASRASAWTRTTPPCAPPARSSTTCATRRRPISRTCARSPTGSPPRPCSSIRSTLEHLEVVESSDGTRAGSLLDAIDRTVTPMGGRLLRIVAAAAARRARADSRSARRGRGARLPHDRARQVPRRAQGRAGPRAARRARGARRRRPARSRRA